MQPDNQNASSQTNVSSPQVTTTPLAPPPKGKSRRWLLAGLVLLLVIAAGILWAIYDKPQPSPTSTTNPYKYSYSQLDEYRLIWATPGAIMTFSKPVELKEISHTDSEAYFEQALSEPPRKVAYLDAFMATATATTSSETVAKATNDYLKNQLPSDWQFSLKDATSIKLASQQSAWARDFTTSGPNGRGGTAYWQGRLLYAPGQKADYYLMAMTVNHNWQSNEATWQKVFSSLKVDQ